MQNFTRYYFLGIGGIGMSAIARYFAIKGMQVAGYDRVPSIITEELAQENIQVIFEENLSVLPPAFLDKNSTLVVRTPAVPPNHEQLQYFEKEGFTIKKRAEILGEITARSKAIAVAGTHGKTTISTMIAHLLYQSHVSCSAFLGGIASNYGTNLLLSAESNFVVVEADEYDRSFHHLTPYFAVITSADPDHLDIYGTADAYREAFEVFTSLIKTGGVLMIRKDVKINLKTQKGVKIYTYSMNEQADFYAENIRMDKGELLFDFVTPTDRIFDVKVGVPVKINVENAVAAMAVAWLNGVTKEELRIGINSFSGNYRRFNKVFKNAQTVLIDDYAHHPEELRASIQSIRELYPQKTITGIFQPHLYSRTQDFAAEFATVLSLLDELILLDIYPAREEAIPGVSSQLIFDRVTLKNKVLCTKKDLIPLLEKRDFQVLVTLGAGDIETLVPQIKKMLQSKKTEIV